MKKEWVESGIAAVLGAMLGLFLSIHFGATSTSVAVNMAVSAAAGFVLYHPWEVIKVFAKFFSRLFFDINRGMEKRWEEEKKALALINISALFATFFERLAKFIKLSSIIILLLSPIVFFGIFTFPYLESITAPDRYSITFDFCLYEFLLITISFIFLILACLISEIKSNSIPGLVSRIIFSWVKRIDERYFSFSNNPESDDDLSSLKVKMTLGVRPKIFVGLAEEITGIYLVLLFSLVATSLFVISIVTDVLLLTANTYRLAAMTGAVVGFITGVLVYTNQQEVLPAYLTGAISAGGATFFLLYLKHLASIFESKFLVQDTE